MSLENKETATAPQIAQFGLLVAQQAVAKMVQRQKQNPISKKEMDKLLTPPYNGEIKQVVDGVMDRVFEIKKTIPTNSVWDRQIEKLTKFWKDNFNHNIVWSELIFPEEKEGFNILEYIPNCFTEDDVFEKYKEIFGKDKVWCYYHTQLKKIRESIKTQQSRPEGSRLLLHCGGAEPDAEHLNKSYDDFSGDGKNYMVPIEGIITGLRYRVETGNMVDVKGLTTFHALDHDGYVMDVCRLGNVQLRIGKSNRNYRYSGHGPREVSF